MVDYQTILLASFMHDIGKFLQKGEFSPSLKIKGKHPQVGADFISSYKSFWGKFSEADILAELVKRHHEREDYPFELQVKGATPEVRPYACLVSKADNYSAAERGKSQLGRDFRTTPLASVFSRIRLQNDTPPAVKSYKIGTLDPTHIFPEPLTAQNQVGIDRFLKDFGQTFGHMVSDFQHNDFSVMFQHLQALLYRYTWCIPSNTQEEVPDVSLYDHLRTTCAIAACLYKFHEAAGDWNEVSINNGQAEKFRLVVGDLSGIQDYIFSISREGVKGVGKRLRARSFFLGVLGDMVAHHIVRSQDLPLVNIVMSSGGRFYVLLPNLPTVESFLDTLQGKLDKWVAERFGAQIRTNLAHVAFGGDDFAEFSRVLASANEKVSEKKARQLGNFLIQNGRWSTEGWTGEKMHSPHGLCACCGRRAAEELVDDVAYCSECRRDLELGTQLANARYLMFAQERSAGKWFEGFEGYFSLREDPPSPGGASYIIYKLNDTNLGDLKTYPAAPKFLANYVPLADGHQCESCRGECEEGVPTKGSPLYFECLAAQSHGRELLGYLKADVDRLGTIFTLGMKMEQGDYTSISRVATLSRMLDLFFSGWMQHLLQDQFPGCYTVFSGGDDLSIIGPWSQIVDLARVIRRDFSKFVGDNPEITLSAGISAAKPRIPLSRSMAAAEEALELAKEQPAYGAEAGRDQICLFGTVMRWSDYDMVVKAGGNLARWSENKVMSAGFVHNLRFYGELYHNYLEDGQIRDLRFIPLLAYSISRNYSQLNHDREASAWVAGLRDQVGKTGELYYLPDIVDYALLLKE